MTVESTTRPMSPAMMRTIDEICDRFEQAWQVGAPELEEYLAHAPENCRRSLVVELATVELLYRRGLNGGIISFDDFVAAHPGLAGELDECAVAIRALLEGDATKRSGEGEPRPGAGASDVVLAPPSESQGLKIRCPHCASSVELLADTPYEDVTCHACGSTFCLVEREGEAPAAASLRTVGRFELVARLGVGGFGTVWKARDPELDRIVALKIPRRGQLRADEIDFFFREARAAAQLRHPHIVAVHEIGRDDDTVFIISDFVRGATLGEWAKAQQPNVREVAELSALVAEALDHAHAHGVVHRDLKPSNIMIDDEGQPRIMDFGLAKRESGEITMTCDGQILGTAAYMSPEQADGRGHWIDRRADVYSLGVVMFQLATGELPYRGSFEVQLASKMSDDAPDPRRLNRRIPRDIATICLKCLERDPNRRYGGAGAVAAELRRFLRGEAIRARPLSRFARLWRWTKRKPALATAAALAGLVMVAGPVTALVINSQRRELDGRVQELDKLVIGQQETNRTLRGKNAELQQTLESLEEMRPGVEENVLEWRRALIAAVVDRHYDAAARALAGDDLDLDSRAQIHLGLGMMLAAIPRVDEAVEHLSTAKDALEELAEENSKDKRILAALADCCEQLAEVNRAAGRDEPAGEAAARAVEIRQRLAGSRPSDAAAQVDVLASHYLLPVAGESLAAIPAASQRVIDEWPSDAAGIYEAACRLTLRTPLLNAAPGDAPRSP